MRLGILAERYFSDDPNTCLLKLRQFAELLAQHIAAQIGVYKNEAESQYELLRRLLDDGILPREIFQLFGELRRVGNAASHEIKGDHAAALNALKIGWQLGVWFHRTFKDKDFVGREFFLPLDDQSGRKKLAAEADQAETTADQKLVEQQSAAIKKQRRTLNKYRSTAQAAAQNLYLDEAATRQLIDQQLRQAGWEAVSVNLRYGKGTRLEKGKNRAIAEWSTASGPADYVLFTGLMPLATVEAKRKNVDVSAALVQAKRYSRDFALAGEMLAPGGPWGEHQIPFAFSSNGRPYLRQLETQSGIWFVDLRHPENLGHALDGWYTPEGLRELVKRDADAVQQQLAAEPFNYGFSLRYYQKEAIQAVEAGIAAGRRAMLIAMATGTGKTKTSIHPVPQNCCCVTGSTGSG